MSPRFSPSIPSIFFPLATGLISLGVVPAEAQITNGVFDPTKVMVAKEKVKELEQYQKNIEMAREHNRTIGTPYHPKPQMPGESPGGEAGESRPPGESAPARPGTPSTRRERPSTSGNEPSARANRIDPPRSFTNPNAPQPPRINTAPAPSEPMVSANPVSINDRFSPQAVANELPEEMQSTSPAAQPGVDMNVANIGGTESASDDGLSLNSAPIEGEEFIPGDTAEFLDIGQFSPSQGAGGDLVMVDENGFVLPSHSSSPDGGIELPQSVREEEKRGFLSFLSRGRREQALDRPDRPIPIQIGSSSMGNPYSDPSFQAGVGHSPLIDGLLENPSMLRDMTQPGAIPFHGIGSGESRPVGDLSQYWVVKGEKVVFEPFQHGTQVVDTSYTLELYKGATVKDLGLVGAKRMIQIDSGERGFVDKGEVRPMSVSEEAVMASGLSQGKRWYSILDTEAEMDAFAATDPRPDPMADLPRIPLPVFDRPDSDLTQYFVVSRKGAELIPYDARSGQPNPDQAFGLHKGALLKSLRIKGTSHIVQIDSGDMGELSVDSVRPLNDYEKNLMTGELQKGRPWYSILDTDPTASVMATSVTNPPRETAPPAQTGMSSTDTPGAQKVTFTRRNQGDPMYFIVTGDDEKLTPFDQTSRELQPEYAFPLYKGALLKNLGTSGNNQVVQSDSGDLGVVPRNGVRILNPVENEQMTKGIASGQPWYSILDTSALE